MTPTHRSPPMPALAIANDGGHTLRSRAPAPANPALKNYRRTARWAKPMPKAHRNFIPAPGWLGYNWTDRDPELDFVLHCIEESGWSLERIEAETEKNGHKVSRHTLIAWFYK